jgi:hypothetical protein
MTFILTNYKDGMNIHQIIKEDRPLRDAKDGILKDVSIEGSFPCNCHAFQSLVCRSGSKRGKNGSWNRLKD